MDKQTEQEVIKALAHGRSAKELVAIMDVPEDEVKRIEADFASEIAESAKAYKKSCNPS